MLQWAASLHGTTAHRDDQIVFNLTRIISCCAAAQPSKQTNKPVADLILAQGWLDLPKEENDDEVRSLS